MSEAMAQSFLVTQFCLNHPNEQLTNFCQTADCLKALCAECIESHKKYHNQLSTDADIESFVNVKQQCQKKIKSGLVEMQKIQTMVNQYGQTEYEDQTIKDIKKAKENVINLVNQYFILLEDQYKQYLESQTNSQQIFIQQQENVQNFINELENLYVGLEKCLQFGHKKKLAQIQEGYEKFIKFAIKTNPSMIKVNQTNLQHIQQALYNYVQIDFIPLQTNLLLNTSQISQIIQETYLQQNEFFRNKYKLLHFFETGKSVLWLFDLSLPDQVWRPVQISNYVEVLPFSKSLITPDGQIYLTGGSLPNKKKSNTIYQFNFSNYQLQEIGQMNSGRSSHGLIWKENQLFIIGGYLDNLQITNQCESFDCLNKRVIKLPNLSYALGSPSVSIFNDTVTVVGGIMQNMQINQQIEFLQKDTWVSCSVTSQLTSMASMMCSIQIEQNQLMIFGGYLENNKGSKECTVLEINDRTAKVVQTKQLPQAEGFWNNVPIIHQGRVLALQNVVLDNQGNCAYDQRRIIIFDGTFWKYNDLK
ncbi:unnamed protein product (macronuclear) [Paramecium tetraurelia]|uniref:B box-type domain-containing protein n=1 Tax=Paramecium tetraurelia TaxID=5888 RepID=A0C917_PARTE|nr:uncharacterized protein GSPATT00006590001 [Paramecium tetraurelia]CAK67284.1 unnamed protein product [Paramecium tetraurelia]|eukprot:XP_001434681.1 hypothetical protein (macronuclear) [Paramecium tetraurelia strain d4-2]